MKTLREELRDHQVATDCSDDRMLQVLCDFLEKVDRESAEDWKEWLLEFVVESLEEGPPSCRT